MMFGQLSWEFARPEWLGLGILLLPWFAFWASRTLVDLSSWQQRCSLVCRMAFALLLVLRDRSQGFLLALAVGTMARLGVLGAAGVVVTVVETGVGAGALLLGLAGFLFLLALLEAAFLRGGNTMGKRG